MKGLFISVLFFVSSLGCVTVKAHDGHHRMNHRDCGKECRCKPYTTLKVVPLSDVLKELGEYSKETTGKAVDGVGTVLKGTGDFFSAPFRSRFRWPEMKHYRWYRGHWHEVPPRPRGVPHHVRPPLKYEHHKKLPEGVRPQDLKPPKIDLGEPVDKLPNKDIQFIPAPVRPEVDSSIVLLELKF